MNEKFRLTREKETLLVPLFSKAKESVKKNPIIEDPKAVEIVDHIDYDYSLLDIPKQTYVTICIRAKIFDNITHRILEADKNTTFLHLGCGLDSRFERLGSPPVRWYDLDYPEVIELRRHFYTDSINYRMTPSPVTDYKWIDSLPDYGDSAVVLAEGLFMYLTGDEIKTLLQKLQMKFKDIRLIFDSYSALTARNVKNHPSIKKTGAVIHWGIDNAAEMEEWFTGIFFEREYYFTESEEVKKLDKGYRILFKTMGFFPIAKKAHRIIELRICR